MRTLNKRKLRWILREVKRGELSIYQIAKQQGVSPRWVRKLAQRYGKAPLYKIETGICGRPAEPVPEEDRAKVLAIYESMPMCAVKIEKSLDLAGKNDILPDLKARAFGREVALRRDSGFPVVFTKSCRGSSA